MGFGAGNRLQLHEITDATPDTIVAATPDIVFEMTISSAWDKVMKLGARLTLDSEYYDDEQFDFINDGIPISAPADPAAAPKYENGTESTQSTSVSSSGTDKRFVYGWYGGVNLAGTKRQTRVGVCVIGQESGAFTTAWQTPTKPTMVIVGQKQKTGNAIAIADTFYAAELVDPEGAVTPTATIAGGTYGNDEWLSLPT